MYQRPKASETEDDLLRMQEKFFKEKAENKVKPAATFVGCNKPADFVKPEETLATSKASVEAQLSNTFEAVPTDINLGNIVEKQAGSKNVSMFKFNRTKGFPQAKRRDATVTAAKGSIFSQQIKKLKKDDVVVPMELDVIETPLPNKDKVKISLPSQSFVITGNESKQIHEENLNLIKNMSEQEILEEREKLIATMDPAIIQFLKSRRKKEVIETRNLTIKEQNEAADETIAMEEFQSPNEVLTQPSAEKWLNFDTVESNKLAWMQNVNIPKIDKSQPFEARFDFEGWLLPFSEPEINEANRILYHHGEEPGRPGYTLQELFQLSRSSVIQQKIVALNCISNILSINASGVYDNVIDIPLEQIFFVVRFCLDDNTPAVLNSSIKAMRNLIFFQIDETLLDSLLGFGLGQIQPVLGVDETEDDNTVNDQQLAETNLIKCLARTDILIRIRYILNTVKPALETVVYCMEILTRLSRDSQFVMTKVFKCEGLIESVVTHFVPKLSSSNEASNSYGQPLLQGVKFLRVLASRSKNIATTLITRYNVMDSIATYLSRDTYAANANGLKLQIECLHFWSLLVHYGLALDYFTVLERVLLQMLDYHFKNTDLNMQTTFVRQSHLAALLIFLGQVAEKQFSSLRIFLPLLLEQCFLKWFTQFSNLNSYACGKLQIISSLLHCLSCIRSSPQSNVSFQKVDEVLLKMLQSKGFSAVTENLSCGSMLLNNYETHKSSSNLKSLEGAAWHTMDHIVPVMQTKSCLPFLHTVAQYLKSTDNVLKLSFLRHENVAKYLENLKNSQQFFLTNNWFTRTESFIIMNILKLSVPVKSSLDTSVYYELAVKSLSVFIAEQKPDIEYLLSDIIFSPKFYPSHVLLEHLDINQRSNSLEISLNNLAEILGVYTRVLGLKNKLTNFTSNFCVDISVGNVIPIDWIYTPIIVLYSNQEQSKTALDEEMQFSTIKNCLRWILIYETYFPSLAATINPTDRFCRLACVFLGSDNLFLNQEIHALLEHCFRNVMKFENDLDFDKEIQGLSNFQDFYTQLLEQYQGVSYGDVLFGNVILIPLAQKQNVQYRKTLWSEYMGAVQIFNVTPEQTICSLDLFLEPYEEDLSLLKSYRRAIVNSVVRKHSVLFQIAKHHVDQFIVKQKNK